MRARFTFATANLVLCLAAVCLSGALLAKSNAQGLETFDNFAVPQGSYVDGSFVGENGVGWNYFHVTGAGPDNQIEGQGMILRRSGENSRIVSAPIGGGIGSLSVQLRKAFTSAGDRQVELLVNGESKGFSETFGAASGADPTIINFAVENINIPGNVVIELRNTQGGTQNRQLTIDNISWTGFNDGGPSISATGLPLPFASFAGQASQSQSVNITGQNLEADVQATAPPGFELSTDNINYASTVTLVRSGATLSGSLFLRVSAAALAGEIAGNVSLASTNAPTLNIAVTAAVRPASLSLPYGPDTFEETSFPWYSFTVAGSQNWTRASFSGNFFMQFNGFGSSVPSDAWLILGPFSVPGDALGVVASFNIAKGFDGPDDELRFVVSTDYSGLGNPTASTWQDVSFNKPAGDNVFVPTGDIQLAAGLAAQSGVYVAFHVQSPGTASGENSRWRFDDFELRVSGQPPAPSINVSPTTISNLSATLGSPGAAQSFNVSGSGLTGNLTVTAPANFEVSTTSAAAGFGPTATVTASGALAATNVWVRIASSAAQGSIGPVNVTVTGGGASPRNVSVSGTVSGADSPTLQPPNNTALSGFTTVRGTPSTNQSFSLSGSNLAAPVTLTPPPGWQISATNTNNFTASAVTIATNPAGVVSSTPIFVRLAGTNNSATSYTNSSLSLAVSGLLTNNVLLSGAVTAAATPTISPTNNTAFSGFTTVRGTNSTNQVFTLSGSNLTANITLTPPAGWQIATNTNNFTAPSVTIATDPAGVVSNTSIFVRLAGTNAAATNYPNSALPLVSGGLTNNVLLSGAVTDPTPVISSSTTELTNFTTSAGTPSTNQIVQVGGQNLQGPITIAAPADFEVSLDGQTFSDGVVLDGTVARDVASNYTGESLAWTNNSDGGFGFAPWVITNSPTYLGFAGNFIGDPQEAGVQGMETNSFALFANPADSGAFANTSRSFAAPLQAGQTFSFQWGVNFDSGSDQSVKGFDVLVDTNTVINVDIGGFQAPLRFNGTDTGIAFGNQAMRWTFTVDAPGNLRVTSTARTNSSQVVFTTNIPVAAPPTGFAFYAFQMAEGADRQPYFNNLQITKPDAEIEPRDVYVRIKGSAPVSTVSGNLTATSPNAAPLTVALRGTVNVPPPTLAATPPALSDLRAFVSQAGGPGSFQLTGSNLTGPVTVTATANFEVSLTGESSGFASSVPVSPSAGGVDQDIFVRIAAVGQPGDVNGEVTLGSDGATDVQVPVSGEVILAAPVVRLISPADGTVVRPGKKVTLRAEVETTGTTSVISRFEFLANGAPIDNYPSPEESPFVYELEWEPAEGVYAITGQATDAVGAVGNSVPVELIVRPEQEGEPLDSFVAPSANGTVEAVAPSSGGAFYIGGQFTELNDEPAIRVARLLADGGVDPAFNAGDGPDGTVRALLEIQSGGLLLGGNFASVDGSSRPGLAKLLPDGQVDTAFDAGLSAGAKVNVIVRQADGKVLVGGIFTATVTTEEEPGGLPVTRTLGNLLRWDPATGAIDADFRPNPNSEVNALAVQPDGKILVGGSFGQIAGSSRNRLARLHPENPTPDVSPQALLDTSFVTGSGPSGPVQSIAVLDDGSVVVGGQFTTYNDSGNYVNLLKLSNSGLLDPVFNFSGRPQQPTTGGFNEVVFDVQVRPSGEILASGAFSRVENRSLSIPFNELAGRIIQLEPGGAYDPAFNPGGTGANNTVLRSATLVNGNLVLVGAFTQFNGQPYSRIVVLAGGQESDQSMSFSEWQGLWFTPEEIADPSISGPGAINGNPSGLSNFMVYALSGGNPREEGTNILPVGAMVTWPDDVKPYFTLSSPFNPLAEAEFLVEYTDDLRNPWEVVPHIFDEDEGRLSGRAPFPMDAEPQQFLRLRVEPLVAEE